MRTFVQKQKTAQQIKPTSSSTTPEHLSFEQSQIAKSTQQLQRFIGNRAIGRLLQRKLQDSRTASELHTSTGIFQDYGPMPVMARGQNFLQPYRKHNISNHIQRDEVTFEEGSTIAVQSLGPHLYDEIGSGLTIEPAPGASVGFWYRIYEARPGVSINRLYTDLETLYGYGRFTNLTRSAAAYLGTRVTPQTGRFFALYPTRQSREPISLPRLEELRLGMALPREVAQPGITTGFTERREEAWSAFAPTAHAYINCWASWSLRGLDKYLDEIPLEEDRKLQDALTVLGNVVWALTSFIPVAGSIARAVVGGISLIGALTSAIASISPGKDLNTERKNAIRGIQEKEIARVADGLEQENNLAPILITALVKAQERGIPVPERDALLWNHMFNIPYSSAERGRREGILQCAYRALIKSSGERMR